MHEHLARFDREEGVLFIGRAQEKTHLFRTERRRDIHGVSYPWIVKATGVVNQFYVYAVDADFGPFFLKFCSYFPYNAKLCLLTELGGKSSQVRGQIPVRVATVRAHDRARRVATGSERVVGGTGRRAAGDRGSVRALPAADASGRVVAPVAAYLRELQARGLSETTQRSYGMALLRWFRFLGAIGVPGEQATRVEARELSQWWRWRPSRCDRTGGAVTSWRRNPSGRGRRRSRRRTR